MLERDVDLVAPTPVELAQRVAVVRMAVHPDDVGLGVDAGHRLGRVDHALEEPCHLVDPVHEDEAAHLGELRRDGVHQVQGEAGETGHRPRDVRHHEDLGLGRARVPEPRLNGHAARRQGAPHRGAEVERTLPAVPALAGQAHRQLARQRLEDTVQHGQFLAGRVHDVDVLGQGFAHRTGQRLGTAILHQAAADLGLHGTAELLDACLELVRCEALLQLGQRPAGGARLGLTHEPLQHGVEVEVPQCSVQVVGPPDGSPGFHACVTVDRIAGHHVHQPGVGRDQRLEEELGQLLGRHPLTRPASLPGASLALHATLPRLLALGLAALLVALVALGAGVGAAGPHGEEDLERRLEGAPVCRRLHESRGQRVLQRLAILERDVLDCLGGVKVLGERDRQPGTAQLGDEPGEEIEHAALSPRRPTATPWSPARCRPGTSAGC